MQKSNGIFELVIWSERVSGSDNINVDLGRRYRSVKIYDPTIGINPVKSLKQKSSVELNVSNHPVIIEIT